MTTLYQKLKALAVSNPHLLIAYHRDLAVHDRRALRRMVAGQRWLWVLRRHGTTMFPVACGQAPIWVTHHLDEDRSAKVFLIHVTVDGCDGTVTEIPRERAVALAREPAPRGLVVWQPGLFHITILRDGNEIGKIERWNDTVIAKLGSELLGRFENMLDAIKAMELRLGPIAPMAQG